ncbi:MAG: hypothetical protein ABI690_33885 [Chloroflexota bacterium]
MDTPTRTMLDNLRSKDKSIQNAAYFAAIEATDQPVDWAYAVWDDMLAGLTDKDNHVRAITAQVLCGLAKSDPEKRILKDFDALLKVTKDERFVTARHCMQSLWKIGVVGKAQQQIYMAGLGSRFVECASEKNCTLIRYDILQSMRNVYDAVHDESIREKALALIETEPDAKFRKKYATLWKK